MFNPFTPVAAKKTPDYFGDISLSKSMIAKYLKESCSLKLYLKLAFKKFEKLCFIPKLFLKVYHVQTILVKKIFRHEWVNMQMLSISMSYAKKMM